VSYYAPVHSVRQIGLAVAATVTVEREQLIGQVNMRVMKMKTATYTRCRWHDVTWLSMDVRDCIRYRNALKLFIHLRS